MIEPDDYEVTLATCELAVLAAGSSLWEAVALGTRTVAVVVAQNQRRLATAAADLGLVLLALDCNDAVERGVARGSFLDRVAAVLAADAPGPLPGTSGSDRAAAELAALVAQPRPAA